MSSDPVADAARAFRRAESVLEKRRTELADVIGHAILVDGRKQGEVVTLTGYTREHVRRICRDYADRVAGPGLPF